MIITLALLLPELFLAGVCVCVYMCVHMCVIKPYFSPLENLKNTAK